MKSNYDLYGFSSSNINHVAAILSHALSIEWALHESTFKGEYYRFGMPNEEEFILQYNFDERENEKEWNEPEFKQYSIILYVNDTRRSEEIKKLVVVAMGDDAVRLRSEEL